MLVGSTSARTGGMLTKVAPWIAMTNAVSAAATCARAEVPASSVSDARSACVKSLPDCCAPAILVAALSRDRLGAVRARLCHKIKQIGVSRSEVFVTGVYEPKVQHA